jgi:ATP-dependent RNA helicase DeaD
MVLENFSYITVSSRDADKIIRALGTNPRNGKPMAEKAKQRRG